MIGSRLLEHVVRTGNVPDWYEDVHFVGAHGHAIRRFVHATKTGVQRADWAVLLRQCLRRLQSGERVRVPRLDDAHASLLRESDVYQELDGTLQAEPYQPSWVADLGEQSVDLPTMGAPAPEQPLAGEPWLRQLMGMDHWKSAAQRDVVWRALNTPPNSTLLVGLPTGSGKSLVYQCCAAFDQSMTVLVVPTTALGLDQLAAVRELPCAQALVPVLYTPGDDADAVLDSVQSRRSRLLITSPEAIVTGRLSSVLRRHAEEGFLGRVVVDEAHLIESWGAEFRIEFQLLAAVLRTWREAAPDGIRALLLSATFAPSTPAMLRELFAPSGAYWEECIVQHLRGEIHYFAAAQWLSPQDQDVRVEEALRRLPRPAILYVTEVEKADWWGMRLRQAGFERLRVFHGTTSAIDRRAIMAAWRADELDLVIGTSAFGMGVDKPDVKAVVHACFPEGIDRFYQEVGRGGRDGERCVSLLAPTQRDERVAFTMGPTLLSDPDKVSGRWRAMWGTREPVSAAESLQADAFKVNTRVQPSHRFGSESFGENANWNKRLLLMMDRAGLVRIEALIHERVAESNEVVESAVIRPLRSTVELHEHLPQLLEQPRSREVQVIQGAMALLNRVFLRQGAVCRELRSHYGTATRRACGSCHACRAGQATAVTPGVLRLDEDDIATAPDLKIVQGPSLQRRGTAPALVQALRQALQSGCVDRFVVARTHRTVLVPLIERADDRSDRPYRIDELDSDAVPIVCPWEAVLVIHVDSIDERAAQFNTRGSTVTHWLLGGSIETTPGRWSFMYDGARAYPGTEGLSQWLSELRPGGPATANARQH
jgi:ATP-dependent DNA helicase RecQ